eukprot:386959_1
MNSLYNISKRKRGKKVIIETNKLKKQSFVLIRLQGELDLLQLPRPQQESKENLIRKQLLFCGYFRQNKNVFLHIPNEIIQMIMRYAEYFMTEYMAELIVPNKLNIQNFRIAITPDSGYWKGATYTFEFNVPDNYPYGLPKIKCVEKIYHPNIDLVGNICDHPLRAEWRSNCGIQYLVYYVLFLLLEPNSSDPLNLDAATCFRENIHLFKQNVKESISGGYIDLGNIVP